MALICIRILVSKEMGKLGWCCQRKMREVFLLKTVRHCQVFENFWPNQIRTYMICRRIYPWCPFAYHPWVAFLKRIIYISRPMAALKSNAVGKKHLPLNWFFTTAKTSWIPTWAWVRIRTKRLHSCVVHGLKASCVKGLWEKPLSWVWKGWAGFSVFAHQG